jgi:multimeric flavodoxin WrbA
MKITILNANPTHSSLDTYLGGIKSVLEAENHSVSQLDLREMKLRYCIGCWGCWAKTPGQCSTPDASHEMDRAMINADFVLWAAPLKMGFPSELLKRSNDKTIPLIHPYMVVDQGEAHHLPRYPKYPRVGLLLEKETTTDDRDLEIVKDIYCRTALNFKTRLEFSLTTETPPEGILQRIQQPLGVLPLPGRLSATRGVTIEPPSRLTLFNGSPRGPKGNTPIFLRELAAGFGGPSETHHVVRMKQTAEMVQAFAEAECVILGFPLYTDAMPGMTKHFIESLEPLVGRQDNPPLGFVVQSGFPEGLHSRYIERYLEKLVQRLGCPYLGTIVKGGGEGTRMMPAKMTENLFANLHTLGALLASEGRLDAETLAAMAKPERYPAILGPVFRLFLRLPIAHGYFDNQLKENGAYDQRYAQPFVE